MTLPNTAALAAFADAGLPRLLLVTHAWGGGVEQHVNTLIASLSGRARVAVLRPVDSDSVQLVLPGSELMRLASKSWTPLVNALRGLDFQRLHLHHVQGFPRAILDLNHALSIPFDCTLHDYASICPQNQLVDPEGRYCGEPDDAGCNRCIQQRPHAWALDIAGWRAAWNATLLRADRVIAPSQSVADKVHRYLPDIHIQVIPHAERPLTPFPRVVKVALLGALSNSKGLAVAVAVANLAQRMHSRVTIRLIGHAAEPLPKNLPATGLYEADELPRLIATERPDVLWLPTQVPETFSYTLSAAIASGLPIVASDLGAFPERLAGVPKSVLLPFDALPSTWHDALLSAGSPATATEDAPSPQHGLTVPPSADAAAIAARLPQRVDGASVVALTELIERSRTTLPARIEVPRALINVFRIGVYGGHHPSTEVIERRLAELPDGEHEIVGRTDYDALSTSSTNEIANLSHSLEAMTLSLKTMEDANVSLQSSNVSLQSSSVSLHSSNVNMQSSNATLSMSLETLTRSNQALSQQLLLHEGVAQSHETLSHSNQALSQAYDALLLSYRNLSQSLESLTQIQEELSASHQMMSNSLDAASDTIDDTNQLLEETRAAYNRLSAEHAADSVRWREALDAAEDRAAAARVHMAYLESELLRLLKQHQELQAHSFEQNRKLHEMWSTSSWRITKPLRFLARRVRHTGRTLAVTTNLVRRSPTLLRGAIARFRRGGISHVLERVELEYRAPDPTVSVALPEVGVESVHALALPTTSTATKLSIIIPVYGQHATTFACLKSIAENPPRMSFEVVVMDDCSPEPAAIALASVEGLRVVRNPGNLGFIGNVNAGAAAARGEWLIILNNDTLVRPNALNALLDTFEQHANVGLVGAKLLNADGTVQEAGGIVWNDGSAWNWGRGQHRDDPKFNFVRDADYCSGAALAIRRDLFLDLNGFDPHYAPAYYEDVDLAFRIRARGMRVLYQPASEVFHLEGVSHGRDEKSGVKAYQIANAKKFFERWQTTLAAHRANADEPELEAHRSTVSNILIVEACMITPDQDAGSVRLLNMLKLLKRDGHHVTFVADNLEYSQKYVSLLQQLGVEVLHGAFAESVRRVLQLRGKSLDTVMICRHYIASRYLSRLRVYAPSARIIFDTIDLHFLREEREAALRNDPAMVRAAAVTRSKEIAVMRRSDITLVVSESERDLLAQVLPRTNVDIISLINDEAPAPRPFNERKGILFIGGFRHPPNVDGVTWYISEVLPHVRKALPDVTTTIVGSNMPDSIKTLACEGVEIKGFVENTEPLLLTARLSIAPLRFGAGIKGKINEAMKFGIPVVATECAVEGMHLVPGSDVLVSDAPEAFAAAIVRAYSDPLLWNTLSQGGLENVRQHFSMEAALPAVRRVFSKVGSATRSA